jgi:hypothetical protein
MKLRVLTAVAAFTVAALAGPGAAAASPGGGMTATGVGAHGVTQAAAYKRHKCTRTSSGTCIRGGEFCPRADYGHNGWDAKGRRYVCKGNHTHPHWEKP